MAGDSPRPQTQASGGAEVALDRPVPPIDNVHLLHVGTDGSMGRYTVHMYFMPEETYLAWATEPSTL